MSVLIDAPSVNTPAPAVENNAPDTSKTPVSDTKQAPKPVEYHEVKINGQVRKFTTDELRTKASLAEAANEKFQKASELSKKHESFRENLKKDFMSTLMDPELGLSKDQIRQRFEGWYKENFIDPETMDPRELEISQLKKEKAEREARDKEVEESKLREQEERDTDAQRQVMQKEIISVVEKSGLPKTRFTAARVAYWMRQNIKNGFNAPEEVIVQQVREERNGLVSSMVKESTAEQIIEAFGDDIVKKIRDYDIAQLKKRFGEKDQAKAETTHLGTTRRAGQKVRTADVDAYFNSLRRSK